MNAKDNVLNMLDRSDTASDPGYASRLIARANVLALLAATEAAERQAAALEDQAKAMIEIRNWLEIIAGAMKGKGKLDNIFNKVIAALDFGDIETATKAIKEYRGY